MDKRYEKFTEQYVNAYQRWYNTTLAPEKLEPSLAWRLSELFTPHAPGSTFTVLASEKAVVFSAEDDEGYLHEIWREEYDTLEDLSRAWFMLSAQDLKRIHEDESAAYFGELEE